MNNKTRHYLKIHQSVMEQLWESLPKRERLMVAEGGNTMADWFSDVVQKNAEVKYNDPEYEFNSYDSFKYSYHGE